MKELHLSFGQMMLHNAKPCLYLFLALFFWGNARDLCAFWDTSIVDGQITQPSQQHSSSQLVLAENGSPVVGFEEAFNKTTIPSYDVMGATYNAETNTWTLSAPLDTSPNPTLPSIAVDSNGNALLVWQNSTSTSLSINYSMYSSFTNSWSSAIILESGTTLNVTQAFPQVSINPNGQGFIFWVATDFSIHYATVSPNSPFMPFNIVGPTQLDINPLTNVAASPQPIAPPILLAGQTVENRFPFQTEYVNQLTWPASSTEGVTSYTVFRNKKLIATIPAANTTTFIFNDQHISLNLSYTYEVIAVKKKNKSSPVKVFIPAREPK
jgi:hypothetical protein